jgi:hypothetical protein
VLKALPPYCVVLMNVVGVDVLTTAVRSLANQIQRVEC